MTTTSTTTTVEVRDTQIPIEVMDYDATPELRDTQIPIEVMDYDLTPEVRNTQIVIETLEANTTSTSTTTTTTTTQHFWEDDFEADTIGNPPADWTETWDTANVDTTVEAAKGAKSLLLDKTSNAKIAVTHDPISSAPGEALALVQAKDAFSTLAGGLGARISGGVGTESGYALFMDVANNYLRLRRYNGGVSTSVASGAATITADRWYWLRLRLSGANIKARIWGKHEAEPGTWHIDHDDGTPITAAGEWGVCTFNADVYCDHFLFESASGDWPITQPNYSTSTTTTTTTSASTTTTVSEGPCSWNDDFTGTNGDPPDSGIWSDQSTGSGSVEIQGNKLRAAAASGAGNVGYMHHKGVITGDFDVQVDIDAVVYPATAGWDMRLKFTIDSTHYMWISLWGESGKRWQMGVANGGSETYPDYDVRTDENGRLRITRSGSTVRVYYEPNKTGGWIELNSPGVAIGSGAGYIEMGTVNWTAYPAATGDFDNFQFNTGCPGGVPGSTTSTTTTESGDTYATDWSTYTPDVAPDDWTERWEPPVAALTVKDDGGQYGAQYLLVDHSTFGHYLADWDDVGVAKDVDVLAKVQFNDAVPASGQDYFKIVLRQTGGSANKNGYEFRIYPADNLIRTYKWVSNAASQIGPGKSKTLGAYWYWLRFQVRGNLVKAKLWSGQPSDEPGTWDIEVTDSAHAGVYGTVGLGSYNGDALWVDYFSVGVGGSDAPAPADYLTTTTTSTTSTSTTTTGTTESPMEPATYISVGTLQGA